MLSFTNKARSAFLAMGIIVTGQASVIAMPAFLSNLSVPAMPAWMPSKEKVAIVAFVACFIRLRTKSKQDYKMSEWKEDLKDLMESLNIFDSALYIKLVKLFDKWGIGRKFALLDIKRRNDKGEVEKDKKVDTKPFGVLGHVDAYFFQQLEKLIDLQENYDKFSGLIGRY